MRRYRLFGEVIGFEGELWAPSTSERPTLTVAVDTEPPQVDWGQLVESHVMRGVDQKEAAFRFFDSAERVVIRVVGSMDVHICDHEIVFHLIKPDHEFLVEILLAGMVLAVWFERRGRLTLHGAASDLDGNGVGFLAAGGMGKSSLVTFLMTEGAPLISEDLLVIGGTEVAPTVAPGLGQLRLWPEQAARVVENWQALHQPHPGYSKRRARVGLGGVGSLSDGPVPLRRLYVLRRLVSTDGKPEILPLPPAFAVEALLSNSYLPEVSASFGWHARRLGQLVGLLSSVDIAVLRYPTGVDHLPAVRELIQQDLGGRQRSAALSTT